MILEGFLLKTETIELVIPSRVLRFSLFVRESFLPFPFDLFFLVGLFFDLEGVQDYVFPGKLEYLFGIYYEENGEKIFKPF